MTRARDLANSADKDIAGTLTVDGLDVSGNVSVDTDTLFVNGANDRVGIQQGSPQRTLHITGNDGASGTTSANSDTQVFIDNDGGNGSILEFGASNNSSSWIMFSDEDAGNRGRIQYNHSEDVLYLSAAGDRRAEFGATEVVLNEDSRSQDFRVESNNHTHALFVDSGNDRTHIGGTTVPPAGTYSGLVEGALGVAVAGSPADPSATSILPTARFSIGGDGGNYLTMGTYTNATATGTAWIQSSYYVPNTAVYDLALNPLGGNVAVGDQQNPTSKLVVSEDNGGSISLLQLRNSNSTYSQSFDFNLDTGKNMVVTGASGNGGYRFNGGINGFVINETSNNMDFRVESDSNANMLFVDAGQNQVGIGEPPTSSTYSTAPLVVQARTKYVDNTQYALQLNSSTYSDTGDYTTMLGFAVEDSGWSKGGIGYTRYSSYDTGYLGFYVVPGGAQANASLADEVLRLNHAEVVVNDRSRSTVDFRVESDSNSNMLKVDASANSVLIGKSSTSASSNGTNIGIYSNIVSAPNGANTFHVYNTSTSTYTWYISSNGTINYTTLNQLSDEREKENIVDIPVGLDAVKQLRPRRFDWRNEGQGTDVYGFIAQEVEAVIPTIVSDYQKTETETRKSIKHVDLIAVLTKAVQEQQTLIEALEARITALENA